MFKRLFVVVCLVFGINALYAQVEKSGYKIIGISDQELIEEMSKWLQAENVKWTEDHKDGTPWWRCPYPCRRWHRPNVSHCECGILSFRLLR